MLQQALKGNDHGGDDKVVKHEPEKAGGALQQIQAMRHPQPAQVAQVIEGSPQEREKIMHFLHAQLGNGFVQQVVKLLAEDKKQAETGDDGQIHIITEAGLRHLREDGPKGQKAARELYDNPNAYIVLKHGQQMPEGWKGNATFLFPSFHQFKAHAHSLPSNTKAVIYDNEHWDKTPLREKQDAALYAKRFEHKAHEHGWTFIAAPTQKWFPQDAKYADIVDVQLQDREAHVGSYSKALEHDAKLAKRENPDVKVVGQITSSVRHLDPTHTHRIDEGKQKAETDVTKNAPDVDGFWGYVYQKNEPSVHAGQDILEDLAAKKEKGAKI